MTREEINRGEELFRKGMALRYGLVKMQLSSWCKSHVVELFRLAKIGFELESGNGY